MSSKKITTRIQNKSGKYSEWLLADNFIPMKGEIIIYMPDNEEDSRPIAIKVGDGITLVNELGFAGAGSLVGQPGLDQLQNDWLQNDPDAANYIKNKPIISDTIEENGTTLTTSKGVYDALQNRVVAQIHYWEANDL